MLKNLLDACGGAVAFYCTGFAIAFGGQKDVVGNTFMGTTNFFLTGDVNASFFFFEFAFSATSVTIIAGTLAERCQMAAYLSYSLFLTGFVYPVVAHSLWSNNGFLSSASIAPILGK
jgi:Amt family ammonium transporter